jgi:hypothetical protein
MQALDYLLPQPQLDLTSEKRAAFDALMDSASPGGWIEYRLPYPKWMFLSYLCSTRGFVLHGSQNLEIVVVEPRKAMDVKSFSNQEAIYATTDGIWAIFFAIVDRQRFGQLALFNSCMDIHAPEGRSLGRFYFFSISFPALVQKPWCSGVVYILTESGFQREPARQIPEGKVTFPHWISTRPVNPAAKMVVHPQDFPFLNNIYGHDDKKLLQLVQADPNGFPWPEALLPSPERRNECLNR